MINIPTRKTSTSATLLDHICTNIFSKPCLSGVSINDISDHLPTFCLIQDEHIEKYNSKIQTRSMKHFNAEIYCEEISTNLPMLADDSNPELRLRNLILQIKGITDKQAPLETLSRRKMKIQLKPWLTKGLLKSISVKNKLYMT